MCKRASVFAQALIYPLTVASKSTTTARHNAANKILKNMCEHSNTLVQQAMMVSRGPARELADLGRLARRLERGGFPPTAVPHAPSGHRKEYLLFPRDRPFRVWLILGASARPLCDSGERGADPRGHPLARDVARRPRGSFSFVLWGEERERHVRGAGAPARHDGTGTPDSEGNIL